MKGKSFKRVLVVAASVLVLVLAFAPVGYAGEDTDTEDGGGAAGGAGTGAGGMAGGESMVLPFSLGAGGVLLLTLAGGLAMRRRSDH